MRISANRDTVSNIIDTCEKVLVDRGGDNCTITITESTAYEKVSVTDNDGATYEISIPHTEVTVSVDNRPPTEKTWGPDDYRDPRRETDNDTHKNNRQENNQTKKFVPHVIVTDLPLDQIGLYYQNAGIFDEQIQSLANECGIIPHKLQIYDKLPPQFNIKSADEDIKEKLEKNVNPGWSFTKGLMLGCIKTGWHSLVHFVPDLISGTVSIAKNMTPFITDPVTTAYETAQDVVTICNFIKDNLDKESLLLLYDNVTEKVKSSSAEKKGEYLGKALGYLSSMYVATGLLSKGLKYAKNLSELEGIAIPKLSHQEAQSISEAVFVAEKEREVYKASCKLHRGLQWNHTIEAKPFQGNEIKSVVNLSFEDIEALTKPLLGEGLPASGYLFGEGGYKEIVKFDRIIGECYVKSELNWISTQFAKIHYRKNGAYHIVPVDPRSDFVERWCNRYE